MVTQTLNPSTLEAEADLCGFKAYVVYIMSFMGTM